MKLYSEDYASDQDAGLKTTKRISRVIRVSVRFRASVSGTVTGLRGTPALVRTRRASVTDLMALMTGDPVSTCCDTN